MAETYLGAETSPAASRLGDWAWDLGSDIVTLSPRAAALFSLGNVESITWQQLQKFIHPEDLARGLKAIEASIKEKTDLIIEYRVINGPREKWVSSSAKLLAGPDGAITGMSGVLQDRSREHLLGLLDFSVGSLRNPHEMILTAARLLGQYLRVNRCAYATVEEDQDTFVLEGNYTDGVQSIVGTYRFRQFGEECLRLMRAGQPYVVTDALIDPRLSPDDIPAYELTQIRAVICVPVVRGGRFAVAMAVHCKNPRQWDAEEVELVQAIAARCWESIERARTERERDALLEKERLAHRSKDEFLAMLGHELRNPLAPIVTALQLMRLRGGDHFNQERTVIERQVTHLQRLIDDLLDVSRIAQGKVTLEKKPLAVQQIVDRAMEMTSPLLEKQKHKVDIIVDPSLTVEGDLIRLSQVLSNLLTNSAKYTPQGGHISVCAAQRYGWCLITIKDNGIGIRREMLPLIFDLFVQGRQGIDRSHGGLGLGLSIAKNIVERHGGKIEAFSEGEGLGSAFNVFLPCSEPNTALPDRDAAGPTAVHPTTQDLKILVVDDNEDAADLLAHALQRGRRDIRIAHDGPSALRICESFCPDVAFLDIGLPVMDGYELATRLRIHKSCAETRLVALTGYGQPEDRRRALAVGFAQHLVKPVDLAQVEAALASLV